MLRQARTFRTIAPLLMALALLARLLVPAGFMPSIDGAPGVMICTGQGAMMVSAGALAGHGDGQDHHADHGCPFASMAAAADQAAWPHVAILPVLAAEVARIALRTATHPGRGLAAPPPPQTGPPLLR